MLRNQLMRIPEAVLDEIMVFIGMPQALGLAVDYNFHCSARRVMKHTLRHIMRYWKRVPKSHTSAFQSAFRIFQSVHDPFLDAQDCYVDRPISADLMRWILHRHTDLFNNALFGTEGEGDPSSCKNKAVSILLTRASTGTVRDILQPHEHTKKDRDHLGVCVYAYEHKELQPELKSAPIGCCSRCKHTVAIVLLPSDASKRTNCHHPCFSDCCRCPTCRSCPRCQKPGWKCYIGTKLCASCRRNVPTMAPTVLRVANPVDIGRLLNVYTMELRAWLWQNGVPLAVEDHAQQLWHAVRAPRSDWQVELVLYLAVVILLGAWYHASAVLKM